MENPIEIPKFSFNLEFQEELLRFIVSNDDGYRAMEYIQSSYFSLLPHTVVCYVIEKFWQAHNRIPSLPIAINAVQEVFSDRRFVEALTLEDQEEILALTKNLYKSPAKDGDILLASAAKFASYVELRDQVEKLDLSNFSAYERFSMGVQKAISLANPQLKEDKGIFFIKDIRDRQLRRQSTDIVIPTPFFGINRLTNAGGYEPGSIIVLLDRPKKLKTTALVNVARGYLRQKKKVIFFDLENGEESLATRAEQSAGRVSKKDIIRGTKDQDIQKILRRYKRLGGEIYIKRIPAFSTTVEMQRVIDSVYREHGIRFNVLVVDYIGLMGSISGKQEDTSRIGDAYIDVANLIAKNKFDHCWTAHHIVRGAMKRQSSRYNGEDIAKSIDIIRHAQAVFGLNRTPEEAENGIVRMEVVGQRDGVPTGRAFFRADGETQRMDELTKKEIEELTSEGILYDPEKDGDEEVPETPGRGDI